MNYSDGIEWLNTNEIEKELYGKSYEFGQDIPYYIQRRMMDRINEPILFCRSPVVIKPFYMQRDPNDNRLAESVNFIGSLFCTCNHFFQVDVLMPGIGEIAGGSMRITDFKDLSESFRKNDLKSEPYYWYFDQVCLFERFEK
jgi:asparaginyl-tRNA synthetase